MIDIPPWVIKSFVVTLVLFLMVAWLGWKAQEWQDDDDEGDDR